MAAAVPAMDRLAVEREQVRVAHAAGAPGLQTVQALSASMDTALHSMWREASDPSVALIALGGYGRGELSPRSDIDLMILHAPRRDVRDLAERLFYPLWDAGFSVGNAVRSVKDCVRLAKTNIEAETSFLQPRLIGGPSELFDEFTTATLAVSRKRGARFVDDVVGLMRERHRTGGSATSQLEPNIKEGTGGLRDLHVMEWLRAVFGDLRARGLLSAHDEDELARAGEMLHLVRNHLHYLTESPTDVLLFQYQPDIAAAIVGEVAGDPEDVLMRDLFAATRSVEQVVTRAVAELKARERPGKVAATVGPFALDTGRVVMREAITLAERPEAAVEVFTLGAPLGADAAAWLEASREGLDLLPWTDKVRAAFFTLLRAGDPVALERCDQMGILGRLLPGWERVRCQPQRNVYHGFTVDAHLFNAAASAASLARDPDDGLVRDVFSDLGDPDALLLAALLHDVGKGGSGDHSIEGEQIAGRLLTLMGIAEDRRATIMWLVRHHLLMVDSATRRDLNDENLIVEVATKIGDPQRARLLFLLSVADGRATGPSAWGSWKATLVAELFTKVMHAFDRGELVSRDAVDLAALRSRELRSALTRHPADAVQRHLEMISRAYILAFPTHALARHFALLEQAVRANDVVGQAMQTEDPREVDFVLIAQDRPGLFGCVSGVLALHGANIAAASGYVRADGWAVEAFRCVEQVVRPLEPQRWARITDDVRRALAGALPLSERLAEKRAAYARGVAKGKRDAPKVIIDNDASDFMTIVEVHAPDRIGLLYDITSVLSAGGMDIQVAKIATYAEDVVDVFYVRDADGQKIRDDAALRAITAALLARLEQH